MPFAGVPGRKSAEPRQESPAGKMFFSQDMGFTFSYRIGIMGNYKS
jgi:hypothetical protein